MIVGVESNFVLEVALGQEQAVAAEQVLSSAERGDVELAIPSFSLVEPFSTITKRHRDRLQLARALRAQAEELKRSTPHQQDALALEPLARVLTEIGQREMNQLTATVERLLAVATVIQVDLPTFHAAIQYRLAYELSEQDAIIYAAIVSHLAAANRGIGPHYFVSRNSKDFGDPGIEQQLAQYHCSFVATFDSITDVLRHHR